MSLFLVVGVCIFFYILWKFVIQAEHLDVIPQRKFQVASLFKSSNSTQPKICEPRTELIDQSDVRLFDDVAKLLFEKAYKKSELSSANQIQYEFLNKMPIQARSQINQFDLEEWSIYWSYRTQSLEYYASRYGVFYTHVDANGVEHKREFKSLVA